MNVIHEDKFYSKNVTKYLDLWLKSTESVDAVGLVVIELLTHWHHTFDYHGEGKKYADTECTDVFVDTRHLASFTYFIIFLL